MADYSLNGRIRILLICGSVTVAALFVYQVAHATTLIQQDDSVTEAVGEAHVVQTLGNGIAGTFRSLRVKFEGTFGGGSYTLNIRGFNTSTYSGAGGDVYSTYQSGASKSKVGTQDQIWVLADFTDGSFGVFATSTTPVFDPAKYYWFQLSCDCKVKGSTSTAAYANGSKGINNGGGSFFEQGDVKDVFFEFSYNPFTIEQPPALGSLKQLKSDLVVPITEGDTTTENRVAFAALLQSSSTDPLQLQVEMSTSTSLSAPFENPISATSSLVTPGNVATTTIQDLQDGQYHWRARAVDTVTNAVSDWQEFGVPGNTDFAVHQVPLYTQVRSLHPSDGETDSWDDLIYADGRGNIGLVEERCGELIKDCGCGIASAVMLMRYYGITQVNGLDVTPQTLNDWLNDSDNNGYDSRGNVRWPKIAEYTRGSTRNTYLHFDGFIEGEDTAKLDLYTGTLNPAIIFSRGLGHFLVADGKLASTYSIKDPAFYKTSYLKDAGTSAHIRDYDNHFDGLRLFSASSTPQRSASIYMSLSSPAEILITDPGGSRVGNDPRTNTDYTEIRGAVYGSEGISDGEVAGPVTPHQTKVIWIPNPFEGNYNVKIIGTESGTYIVDLLVYDQNGQSKSMTQEGSTVVNDVQEFELDYSREAAADTETRRIVNIDIKPDGSPNSINLKSRGVVPVAVLSDPSFDAREVVTDSVVFAEAPPLRGNFEDVDSDGDLDLLLHFALQSLQLASTDTEAALTGRLENTDLVKGVNSIRIVSK